MSCRDYFSVVRSICLWCVSMLIVCQYIWNDAFTSSCQIVWDVVETVVTIIQYIWNDCVNTFQIGFKIGEWSWKLVWHVIVFSFGLFVIAFGVSLSIWTVSMWEMPNGAMMAFGVIIVGIAVTLIFIESYHVPSFEEKAQHDLDEYAHRVNHACDSYHYSGSFKRNIFAQAREDRRLANRGLGPRDKRKR